MGGAGTARVVDPRRGAVSSPSIHRADRARRAFLGFSDPGRFRCSRWSAMCLPRRRRRTVLSVVLGACSGGCRVDWRSWRSSRALSLRFSRAAAGSCYRGRCPPALRKGLFGFVLLGLVTTGIGRALASLFVTTPYLRARRARRFQCQSGHLARWVRDFAVGHLRGLRGHQETNPREDEYSGGLPGDLGPQWELLIPSARWPGDGPGFHR